MRAARYLPLGVRDGRRVVGPDEDLFTVAATALERVVEGLDRAGGPIRVEWIGGPSPELDWAVPIVLGAPAQVEGSADRPSALAEAIARARAIDSGLSIVLGSQMGGGSSVPENAADRTPGGHDGGFALAFATGGPSDRSEIPLERLHGLRAGAAIETLYRDRSVGGSSTEWVGDWDEGSTPSRAPVPVSYASTARPNAVSEGAYLPRPRYVENLPSRWRFAAEQCGACQSLTFPGRGRCRGCGRTSGLSIRELPRNGGSIVATTTIGRGAQPTEFDPIVEALGPYQVVLAELAPGARIPLQVTDSPPGELRIGDRVDTALRRLYAMEGEWRYGRKAIPARPRPSVPT